MRKLHHKKKRRWRNPHECGGQSAALLDAQALGAGPRNPLKQAVYQVRDTAFCPLRRPAGVPSAVPSGQYSRISLLKRCT
jgi:hypothetical protein